jgi:hypothetical protein
MVRVLSLTNMIIEKKTGRRVTQREFDAYKARERRKEEKINRQIEKDLAKKYKKELKETK